MDEGLWQILYFQGTAESLKFKLSIFFYFAGLLLLVSKLLHFSAVYLNLSFHQQWDNEFTFRISHFSSLSYAN